MKIIKILLSGVVIVVLLAAVLLGAFVALFDANEYKQELSQLVKDQTGRELLFSGDIGLTIYPAIGMKLGAMTFSNAPGFGDKPMLSVSTASVSVDVLSLLSFNPEIEQLVLDGLSINLQKNTKGKTNWDDLIKPSPAGKATAKSETAQVSEGQTSTKQKDIKIKGSFGGLNITNADIVWQDRSAEDGQVVEYKVEDFSMQTTRIELNSPFSVEVSMLLKSLGQAEARVMLKTEVLLKDQTLSLTGLELSSDAKGQLIPVDNAQLSLKGDVDFSLSANTLSIKGLNSQVKTKGGPVTSSDLSLMGGLMFDLNKQHLRVDSFSLGAEIQGDAIPKGKIKAAINAEKLNVKLPDRSIQLEELVLGLNENQFKGFVHVADFAQPSVKFELASKKLDVDKLTGYVKKTAGDNTQTVTAENANTSASKVDPEIKLPMELLRSLQIDGKLHLQKLIAQGLTVTDVMLKVDANKGVIDLKPIQLSLYEGKFNAAIQVNAKGEKPSYKVNKELSGFQAGKFLQDFMGEDRISGETNLNVNLVTKGELLSQLKSNLNGDLSVTFKDGSVKGINIRHQLDVAAAKLKGEKEPELKQLKTDFSALSLSGVIKNGVFSSNDLIMQAPFARVSGKGKVSLVKETVDYRVEAKLVGSATGQQGEAIDELKGLLVPVSIRGPWSSPEIKLLYDELLNGRLDAEKEIINKQIEQQKSELKKQLAAQKDKLRKAKQKEIAAEKAKIEKEKAIAKAKLEAKKAKIKKQLEAEKAKAKKQLEDELKKLF